MPCNAGRFCPPIYVPGVRRYCVCPDGWSGLECNVCMQNSSCSTNVCDKSVYLYKQKYYSCVVTSPQVNGDLNNSTASASLDCLFPTPSYNTSEGTCSMHLYYKETGVPLYFSCNFTLCNIDILPGQVQAIQCGNSSCACTSYCGFFLGGVISGVTGPSSFSCDKSGNCTFWQNIISAIIPAIPLACNSGECHPPPPIPPVPVLYTHLLYVYLSSGTIVVGLILIATIVYYIVYLQQERRKPTVDVHINCELKFNNITCIVREKKLFSNKDRKVTTILDNVSGACYPGQLTALMGLSGSGKTSLLDILSGRKNVGDITGEVLINGAKMPPNFKRISGYVTQEDIMIGTLTCFEHLHYTAMLKLPESMAPPKKVERVNSVLAELGLSHVAHNRIGTPENRGISGGERRRLSIAAELLVDPSILFLDEPTSGLDSHSASELMTLLKQLAKNRNRTIIFSIHQPSAEIFDLFDNLIILHHGHPYYSGRASESVQYFVNQRPKSLNEDAEHQKFLMRVNPADFIISAVNDKSIHPNYEHMNYVFNESESSQQDIDAMESVEAYATSFWTQFFVVAHRSLLNYIRNPFLLRTTYFVHISVGFILGVLFWKLPANLEPGAQNRFGSMFFMISLLSFGSITSLDLFYNDRIIFIRERANGYYRTSSYFLAKVLTDLIPMRIIPPILLGSICYYMIGFRPGFDHFLYFLISLVLTSSTASAMCMAISMISPTFGTANMISILLLFVFLLFDGFLLARQSIPVYLKFLVWCSFMSYGLEIPVVNEFDGLWVFYNPPNTNGTWADGLEFLQTIGADPNRLFTDMYVLVGMIGGYILLAYIFLRYLVREYR
ncbi:hypothetical protein SAMD00019534_012170 [Acytostelium subglobosum LB1]|uniref:hypothetical protein n=1 Tax=Acytostelium subglobosum LB1 TaxID=1410327 RepID=UPI00064481B5|nr:hypothetical protein SAMD00019534_012170 [Acytostelium subglobosum LB1]GAM18042.1 hypothetical protein SAMD00019534_012170 [Acytostelium subglobosum LB1]|eukprot:XP_012758638.1 hypothetical protein SAMD00019534_012170 [Acytostelium subglobosum LB1]